MTHPAQHHVDASKKRQKAWVDGRARGGKSDRPGKNGALKGGASEDRETQSDTLPLVPHIKSGQWPVADTVKAAEGQPERARGGRLRRADGGDIRLPGGSDRDRGASMNYGQDDDMRPLTYSERNITDADKKSDGMDTTRGKPIVQEKTRGGKLTAAERREIPSVDFALPGGRYPIENVTHARNALARGAQHASPAELAAIKRKVHEKYPSIKEG